MIEESYTLNSHFLELPESYLFTDIAHRVAVYRESHPDKSIISLGIGDVTRPLTPTVIAALHQAVDEMGRQDSFHGYGPEQGYGFLREAIIRNDYLPVGVELQPDEVFISDGAKSDLGNITDILALDNRIAVTDPVYPVYVDSNVMAGRAGHLLESGWSDIIYMPCTAENQFVPQLPQERPDVIYLCYPNNPTGMALTRDQLKVWVEYAQQNGCLILFDSAYEAYIQEADVPHSIYEIPGAKQVAIEFRSYSKTAGFTGLRCGYTVVPHELKALTADGEEQELNSLWNRRQCTKFNGTAYIVQRAAEAIYSQQGREEVRQNIAYYMNNARIIREGLQQAGYTVYGGLNAPYVWLQTPDKHDSWEFFSHLLEDYQVVGTPGVGFGPSGQGYIRLTAFNTLEATQEAVDRLVKL